MKGKFLLITILLVVLVAGGGFLFWQSTNHSEVSSSLSSPVENTPQPTAVVKSAPSIDHVFIIVMENKMYDDIVGNANNPYINSLIHQYAFADNYSGVTHPSLPNYLAIIGGDTYNITSDCITCYVNAPNLVDQLEQGHKTWKAYMQSIPNTCFVGDKYPYAQKHDPFIYFDDIRKNPDRCSHIVPFTDLQGDMQSTTTAPNFIWVGLNLCNDTHDCPAQTGDKWLSTEIPLLLASPVFTKQNSLLFLTWDEGEGSGSNHIPTIVIGNSVKKGYVSHIAYTHYSLLHTIESFWGLPALTTNVSQSTTLKDLLQ